MLGLLIAFFGGGFIGLCIGVWLVVDNVRHSPSGCVCCGRPWHEIVDLGAHVARLEHEPDIYDQDTKETPHA